MKAEIFLPWPDRRLSPNSRQHWASLARAKKSAKRTAYYTALEAGLGKIAAETITVRYSFYPPDRRTYDRDNLIARMKAGQDGIAAAIGVDDGLWVTEYDLMGPVEKNGMVKVDIEWNEVEA